MSQKYELRFLPATVTPDKATDENVWSFEVPDGYELVNVRETKRDYRVSPSQGRRGHVEVLLREVPA